MSRFENIPVKAICETQSIGESLGITSEEIKSIVESFYKKVKIDNILGPIFAVEMLEDWDGHLEKMCRFWTTVMFGKASYKGNPLVVHQRIGNLSEEHFDHWLLLFKQTLIEVCPNQEHVAAFYQRANKMANVIMRALSGTASVKG